MEQLAASLPRPLGAGVDEQCPGLQLAAGVGRAAQVVVGEASVGEEQRTADRLVSAEGESDAEALAEPLGERAVVRRREEVELVRSEAPHRAVVDRAEALERFLVGRPAELQLSARDCQVRLTSFRHPSEPTRGLVDPARVDRGRRPVLADLHLGLVALGQLFRAPQEGV